MNKFRRKKKKKKKKKNRIGLDSKQTVDRYHNNREFKFVYVAGVARSNQSKWKSN